MKVSLICSCKNRVEPLKISLASWLNYKEIHEIIIVDWSSDEPIDYLTKLDPRIFVITVPDQKYFNQPQPLNLAASLATGDYILKVDGDYILSPYFNFFDYYKVDAHSFVCGQTDEKEPISSSPYFKYLRGLLFITAENYAKVGGYNEIHTQYYAYEDDEIVARLEYLGLTKKKVCYNHHIIHIPHPDKKRIEHFEAHHTDTNLREKVRNSLSHVYSGDELQWQEDYVLAQHHIEINKQKSLKITDYYFKSDIIWNLNQTGKQTFIAKKQDSRTHMIPDINKKHGTGKLENFPKVYYISLEESIGRRKNIDSQFGEYQIKPTPIISKRFKYSNDIVCGKYLDQLLPGTIGCAVSHLKAIKHWYTHTIDDYGFFCEDDLSLETVKYWDFTWQEFVDKLPEDWECVQLTYLREGGDIPSLELKPREWNDWSVTAYIINREYAKKIIDSYCDGSAYKLELKDSDVMPLVETLFYSLGKVYSVPLFVEDCSGGTTFVESEHHNPSLHDRTHKISSENTLEMWRQKHMSSKRIVDYFPFFAPTGREMLELRINIFKDYVDEFIICESNKTQSGSPIEYELEKILDELKLPKEKIRIIKLDIPDNEDLIIQEIDYHNCYDGNNNNLNSLRARVRERMQKDALLSVLDDYSDDTVFIHSDIDEIIKPDCIEFISNFVKNNLQSVTRIPIVHLEGRADYRVHMRDTRSPKEWTGMFVATKTHLLKATPTQIRSNVFNPYPINFIAQDGQILQDLGWHFSWMGDPDIRKIKCKAFTHYDDKFGYLATSKYSAKDTEDFHESLDLKEGSISPSGDKNTILVKYPKENLPKEIFELPRVEKFLFYEPVNFSKMNDIQTLLTNFSMDVESPEKNFALGVWYEERGHTAPALSYFLRCAERSTNDDLAYEALIKGAFCYERQGTRDGTAKGLLQQAIVLMPRRPEAYFLISRFAERRSQWQDCYIYAEWGLVFADFDCKPLITDVEYPGRYGLLFEKAISGWWWEKTVRSKDILLDLYHNHEMNGEYTKTVFDNLIKIGVRVVPKQKQFDFSNEYNRILQTPNGIKKNVSVLYELAKECKHITEFGDGSGVSTTAFLNTDATLRTYENEKKALVDNLFKKAISQGKDVKYYQSENTMVDIEQTDLLYIDTYHEYHHLQSQLSLHHQKVKKYLVFNGTCQYAFQGESPDSKGILVCIIDFITNNSEWKFRKVETSSDGLVILERN